MTKRRGNQEGTFYQRANGTWCGQIMINNTRYTVYAKGIQECRRKLRDKIQEEKTTNTSDELFYPYAIRTIEKEVNQKEIKRTTSVIKKCAIDRFENVIGNIKIGGITADHVNKFVGSLLSNNITPGSINTMVGYVLSIINTSVVDGLRDKGIPPKLINKPPKESKKRKLPTVEEVKSIIMEIKEKSIRVFLYILLYSGLRGGEAIALKWSDIDLDKNKIYINRGYTSIGQEVIISSPKSNRIGEYAQFSDVLKNILLEYKKERNEENLFDVHKALEVQRMRNYFSRHLKKHGFSGGLHVLRHLHASILINNHVDIKTIQSQLRHADISTTNKYLHSLQEDVREDIKKLNF